MSFQDWSSWGMLLVVFFNAAYYTYSSANPLVSSDGWYFLDTFVGKALDGTVTIGDFFAKRDGVDHAQPLNKLFLMVNARYFGLDFIYEGLVGVAFAALGFLVLKHAADQDWRGQPRRAAYYFPLIALAAVYVSLNSSMVFSWPLVAFGYVTNFFLFVTALLAWNAASGQWRWYVLALTVTMLAGDDAGILLAISLALAFMLQGARTGHIAHGAKMAAVTMGIAIAYAWLYASLAEIPAGSSQGTGAALRQIVEILMGERAWKLLVPLASSVAYQVQLVHYFPVHWEAVQIALIILMLFAHIWFWVRSLTNVPSAAGFVADSMMLLVYVSYAAVLYGRVSVGGVDYLGEPRYVAFYQISMVALMLRVLAHGAASPRSHMSGAWRRSGNLLPTALAGLLILVQIPLSKFSWWEAQFNRQYWQTMAVQMARLADTPADPPSRCVANLVVCQWAPDKRARALGLLKQYQLNLFSPDFRRRHRLYMD
jgi:hypothetical protein